MRFGVLDACRGLCAVAVMLFHLDARTHFYSWPVVRNGYLAVDFFFVISGFVIASAYGAKLRTAHEVHRFSIRRLGRLYPLHAAALGVYAFLQCAALAQGQPAFSDNYSLPSLLCNVLLVQGFGSFHETWNYPAWSISIELWANLVFGVYVYWFGRRSVLVSAAILALSAAYVAFGGLLNLPVSSETAAALLDVAQSVFAFVAGTFLYSAYVRVRATRWRPAWAAECLALTLVALTFGLGDRIPGLLVPPLFCTVVLIFSFEAGPISALLRRPLCTGMGAISYSVYLTHSLYLMAMESAVIALGKYVGQSASILVDGSDLLVLGGPWAMDAAALLCVVVALAGSTLTYRFIEEPARRFFNALSDRRAPRALWAGRAAVADDPSSALETTTV